MAVEMLQDLSIPAKENKIFLSPHPAQWPSMLVWNSLAAKNLPGRSKARVELLKTACDYTARITNANCLNNTQTKLIATGHQATWHHCGIWAKTLAAGKFAEVVGGRVLHVVLDHDICDTAIIMPKEERVGGWSFERVEIETEQKAIPLELRPLAKGDHLRAFSDAVMGYRGGQLCKQIWLKWALGKNAPVSRLKNVAELITSLQSMLNIALGLHNVMYLPVSELAESNAFMDFASSIILDVEAFAHSYNNGIDSRASNRCAGPRMGMRRLEIREEQGSVELPFWLISSDGRRESLYAMSNKSGSVRIGTAAAELGRLDPTSMSGKAEQLRDMLNGCGCRLRPKAVSLTLFLRLFLADWFVHGLGGALYEAVTDHIIKEYFSIEPPAFGVATCTMTLPGLNDAAEPDGNEDISLLKHKLHNIRHNPEKYIDKSVLAVDPAAALLRAKQERILQLKGRSLTKSDRKSVWNSLCEINERLFEYAGETANGLEKAVAQLEKDAVSRQVCSCREFFFGLFPEKILRKLAESLSFAESQG